jgi:hypothetical protein
MASFAERQPEGGCAVQGKGAAGSDRPVMPMQARRVDSTPESSRPKTENGTSPSRDDHAVAAELSETGAIDVQTLLHLQRTLGNQAVAELLHESSIPRSACRLTASASTRRG